MTATSQCEACLRPWLKGNWTAIFSLRHITATISWVFITVMRSLYTSCSLITLTIPWGTAFLQKKTEAWKRNVPKATELVGGLPADPIPTVSLKPAFLCLPSQPSTCSSTSLHCWGSPHTHTNRQHTHTEGGRHSSSPIKGEEPLTYRSLRRGLLGP